MIENEVKTTSKVTTSAATGKSTSPISGAYNKKSAKKTNAFFAWLNDQDLTDEKVTAKVAATSYAKGLIEVVKTIYRKPVLSAITIACGAALTFIAKFSALAAVMSISAAAGAAGILYAGYTIATNKSNITTKQAYEVLGISTFVLGLGIYGLLI